jgi:DNA-binding CsgD family transcriptional regulator
MSDNTTDILPYVRGSATSKSASESMRAHAAPIRQRVYEYILSRGAFGCTDEELIAALGISPSTARPRRGELVQMGAVKKTGDTRRTRSGRRAAVYVGIPGKSVNHPLGRRSRPDGERRDRRVNIHLTGAEYEVLRKMAAKHGIDPGAMARAWMVHGYQAITGKHSGVTA